MSTSPPTRRVLELVELLARSPERRFTQADLVRELGLSKATCHAIVTELAQAGWLARSRDDERSFALGGALLAVTRAVRQAHPLLDEARGPLEDLSAEAGGVTIAGVLEEGHIVPLARYGTPLRSELRSRVGQRIPLTPPFGITFVAWEPPDVIDRWVAGNGLGPGGDPDVLLPVVASVRRAGFSLDQLNGPLLALRRLVADSATAPGSVPVPADQLNEALQQVVSHLGAGAHLIDELKPGCRLPVNLISAPVFDAAARVQLNLSLQLARDEMGYDELHHLAGRLVGVARQLTAVGGGQLPDELA